MYTFEDFQKIKSEQDLIKIINEHKQTQIYLTALEANEYDAMRNVEILRLQKYIYDELGNRTIDTISPNNKICSGFFPQFITQENQYALKNGVEFSKTETKRILGNDFNRDLTKLGRYALLHGKTFGYHADKKLYCFPVTQFCPLYSEITGEVQAGIRFWQIDENKPLNIEVYRPDGIHKYILENGVIKKTGEKKYLVKVRTSTAFGIEVMPQDTSFPIIELKGNSQGQSELVGIKGQIDSYDRIKSGFANDFDENALIYWIIKNGGGMSDTDLKQFRRRIYYTGVAVDDENEIEMQTKDIPYEARMSYLEKLEADLYRDFGAVNTGLLSGSNMVTAQIRAAYEALDAKASAYIDELKEFISKLLKVYNIEDSPRFIKAPLINEMEETQRILMLAPYLDEETLLKKMPGILPEEVKEILKKKEMEQTAKYSLTDSENNNII